MNAKIIKDDPLRAALERLVRAAAQAEQEAEAALEIEKTREKFIERRRPGQRGPNLHRREGERRFPSADPGRLP